MKWSFAVREIFYPRSQDNEQIVILAGDVLTGEDDAPIGHPVQVFVGGKASGRGIIVARLWITGSLSKQRAYRFEGSPITREDISIGTVLWD